MDENSHKDKNQRQENVHKKISCGANFHGGILTPEKQPLGKLPPGKLPFPKEKKKKNKKIDSRENYLLGKM